MHKNSHSKMEWFKNTYLNITNKLDILDVGSLDGKGNYNYSDIFDEENWTYTGLDFKDGNNVDIVVTDIYNWFEIEDNSYDVIISGQLFEHLEFFWLTMSQIERVLKPGGYVCIIVPSAGPRHGGNTPNCYLFYEDGMKALAKYVDLNVLHASVDEREEAAPWNDACLVAQKAGTYANNDTKELENRMNNLEKKLDTILDAINK
ncbi:bifunctional 2-polyprenyl-6-hydroxyphenol methylase/3-demethylubiquinol 3-O-methyltransferase UbiG [uncultured Methanobrevibacter sp.]|uniref:class I SAM-dependent methyltransferase n=1 Tax=uncultured Methanobrevibacter sp. TaxID=253161 RepID=UPI0025DD2AE5|nr:class I SAM-dependent methyltransferase [uncultured Methanobrevibacter sp.]